MTMTMEMQLEADADPNVVKALRAWRHAESNQQHIPAYWILSNRMLLNIALHEPTSLEGLQAIPGIGRARIQKYGAALIDTIVGALRPTAAETAVEAPSSDSSPVSLDRLAGNLQFIIRYATDAQDMRAGVAHHIEMLKDIESVAKGALATVQRLIDGAEVQR